jgi:hypothetical protein
MSQASHDILIIEITMKIQSLGRSDPVGAFVVGGINAHAKETEKALPLPWLPEPL